MEARLYPQALGSLFVASYCSAGVLITLPLGTDHVENTVSKICCIVTRELVAVGICLFVKALLSNECVYLLIKDLLPSRGCCFEIVTQQRV
jgi:hypothetical protein